MKEKKKPRKGKAESIYCVAKRNHIKKEEERKLKRQRRRKSKKRKIFISSKAKN